MTKFIKRWFWRFVSILIYVILIYQLWIFGHIIHWNKHNPTSSAFMINQLNVLQENDTNASLQHQWVAYEQISFEMKRAIIAAEDGKFMQHHGFDFESIEGAARKMITTRKMVAGGSTISQQLAKNLFLSSEKTLWRKLQEASITLMLESTLSKHRILEIYLNMIEWGNGVFGIEAAARHYYGISASELSATESSYLAAMVTNPRYYDKNRMSSHLLKKSEIIYKRLHASKIP